jgi:glucose 1-dehydrogenase
MTSKPLQGKVAFVTGASRGIGRSTALALADAGAAVGINYRSHAEEAEQVAALILEVGGKALTLQGDVASNEEVTKMLATTARQLGEVDIAVSNAAYSDRDYFYQADLDEFRRTVDVTMWGALYLTRAAARRMIDNKVHGSIVIVSSPHAFIPAPRAMAYNMSKAAIEQMAKTAAIELAEYRIRVNIVQPGWTDTPGERKFADEDTLQQAGAKIPMGRLGTPNEMGRAIAFLCDPQSEYITGSTLLVDGGISLPWWAARGSAAPS